MKKSDQNIRQTVNSSIFESYIVYLDQNYYVPSKYLKIWTKTTLVINQKLKTIEFKSKLS